VRGGYVVDASRSAAGNVRFARNYLGKPRENTAEDTTCWDLLLMENEIIFRLVNSSMARS
jgi:hypothetical protein